MNNTRQRQITQNFNNLTQQEIQRAEEAEQEPGLGHDGGLRVRQKRRQQ